MFGGAKSWAERSIKPKLCRVCDEEFQPSCGGNIYCDKCAPEARRKLHRETQKEWRNKNPERHAVTKANFDLKKFGLTFNDYNRLFENQNGACAICKTTNPKGRGKTRTLAVDHCHKSGKIRALLCNSCNGALGMVKDNVQILKDMINYLEKHK
ncbi:MAG: endonuclease VII domain-containing protein [Patescibacteria group bacterium]|nr:endonuclease VII domain-containing protein [Patescibacteria group bacterium]